MSNESYSLIECHICFASFFAFFLQQISLSAKFAKVGGKGTRPSNCQCQCICELKFPSVGNQDGSKKVKCKNGKRACHSRSILIFAAAAMKLQIEGMVG